MAVDLDSRIGDPAPFGRSLRLIAEAALRQNEADVACVYEYMADENTLYLRGHASRDEWPLQNARISLPDDVSEWVRHLIPLHSVASLVVTPLREGDRLHGLLTIGWRRADVQPAASIESLAEAALTLLRRTRNTGCVASEVAALEAELADLKIASVDFGAGDRLRDHIEKVLQNADSASVLKQQLHELRDRIQDRRLLADAKTKLRSLHQMTEEQAYLHLRNTSRRQRRPIRDVAKDVLSVQM